MVDSVVTYERKISSADFVNELKSLFDKLHFNKTDATKNEYLKPVSLNPLQAVGLQPISLEEVLASSSVDLIKSLSPYKTHLDSLGNFLSYFIKEDVNEETALLCEKLFLRYLLEAFENISTNKSSESREEKDEKLAQIKTSINHLFQYLGASTQPIIDAKKLADNNYKDANYYEKKLGKGSESPVVEPKQFILDGNSPSSFVINKNNTQKNEEFVDEIFKKDSKVKVSFPYSFYQSQVSKLRNDYLAYYMSVVISFGEGSNAWRGLYLFLSATTIASAGMQTALVMSLPLIAGYCSQQVNQTLFYVSIKDTLNKISDGLLKKSDGEEISNYGELALLGLAVALSLCAAFALTGILQFSSTITLFNLIFSALPTTISVMLPEILPTILSASIAAFSFVGFSSIFALSFIDKTKDYIEGKENKESDDSLATKIAKFFVTSCAVSAHAFQCITSVDSLPGIKEYSAISKSLIVIAELPFSTFLYSGISSFVDIIINSYESFTKKNNNNNDVSDNETEVSPVYKQIKDENNNNRNNLSSKVPVNAFANSMVFGFGISGTLATAFPSAGTGLVTALAVGGAMSIFSGSYGNNNNAVQKTTESPKPIKFAA